MKEPIVELVDVNFHYGKQPVLEKINLSIQQGDFLGIVGPNGSGKSTLLKIIVGLLKPTSGRIYLFNHAREDFHSWNRIGYVAQNTAARHYGFPATVREVVTSGLTASLGLFRRPGYEEHRRVEQVLSKIGILEIINRSIGELSGGQLQRVFISRALVAGPELLILDEPTVGVDIEARETFFSLLEKLRQDHGITLVMVSHDIGAITEKVQKIACLNKKLYYHGDTCSLPVDAMLQAAYGASTRILQHRH